ncbi:MAG: signal peptidase I [Coriobacteriia bacterium]
MTEGAVAPLRVLRRSLGILAVLAWGLVLVVYGATIVRGGSMEPTLAAGDVVVYRRGDAGLERGAIVLLEHAGWNGGVVHRVVRIDRDGAITTRGDANDVEDRDPVRNQQVRGVAVAVIPTGKVGRTVAEALR